MRGARPVPAGGRPPASSRRGAPTTDVLDGSNAERTVEGKKRTVGRNREKGERLLSPLSEGDWEIVFLN